MSLEQESAARGFKIVKSLPSISSGNVFLAKKNHEYFVLKQPEPERCEREALFFWKDTISPFREDIPGGAFVLHYLQGNHPFYWQEEDFQKIKNMFIIMRDLKPNNLSSFQPLSDHLDTLRLKYPDVSFPDPTEETTLIHGDLHPWNLFVYKKAKIIDPYGLRGELGFDVAFLAASLAHGQQEFLERMSSCLDLSGAQRWFAPLVLYRLQNSEKYGDHRAARVLRRLATKIL